MLTSIYCKTYTMMVSLIWICRAYVFGCAEHTQQKQRTIAGSAITQNNIRHYIKPMPPRSSGIMQLGYPLINAVGHFMARLGTKHSCLYIKHTGVDVGFVAQRLHILRHTNRLLASFLCANRLTKRLNNAFIT